jgi:hypothetical protein
MAANFTNFIKVMLEELSLEKGKLSPLDLYVFLHASGRYHPIVKKGELLGDTHWANLLRLQGSNLFVSEADLAQWKAENSQNPKDLILQIKTPVFEGEVLGQQAKAKLQQLYIGLVNVDTPPKVLGETLVDMSEKLMETLVPELRDTKSVILQQLRYIHLMNQVAAISSLAILVALANGFESRTVFSNLSLACLLMDAGLIELSEREIETYYRNRSELPTHVMDRIKMHPLKSSQMVSGIKEANEVVMQLILVHHELHNGKGYHRGVRTANLSPLARNLSYAVDLYEHIKGAELRKEKLSLAQALVILSEKGVPMHERRHSADISAKLGEYLKLPI